jgi:hypothetical protein
MTSTSHRRSLATGCLLGILTGLCVLQQIPSAEIDSRHAPVPLAASRAVPQRPVRKKQRTPSVLPAAEPAQAQPVAPSEEFYYPRDPDEWQGLKPDLTEALGCEAKDGCNLALACIEGVCLPCQVDEDCAAGESCSMDHCVPTPNVTCRSRRDCGSEELCFLSGYSATARSNETMFAYCASSEGENPYPRGVTPEEVAAGPSERRTPEELGGPFVLEARMRAARASASP